MTSVRLKVFILGGYGTFGGRLARLLAEEDQLTIFVAGRSKKRAEEFCTKLPSKAALVPVTFDRDGHVEAQLGAIKPDIVVDASGPFQVYGGDPYRVVRAAIACGSHYIDLADGAEFVEGIAAFDSEARKRNVFMLSGASSVPTLTAAMVRRLAQNFPPIDDISGGIASSPYAGLGLSVIRAIASYAGKPVALIHDGKPGAGFALVETRSITIAPPGRLGLKSIRFSLVDVPDLKLLPRLWPNLRSVWFGAGPQPELPHRVLNALAWLVRVGILPSLLPFAPLMHWTTEALRWGEHRSGMIVTVGGRRKDGERVERSLHLVAEGDDGPFIPAMGAQAIIRHFLAGRIPESGARPAVNDLEFRDYEILFAGRKIASGIRETSPETAALPLYRRLLGDAYGSLPEPLRELHDFSDRIVARGRATVERGGGWLARIIANAIGFPAAGTDVAVEVDMQAQGGREHWRRSFAGRSFASRQEAGRGRFEHLLCETFGPCVFGMALVIEDGRMLLRLRRWSIFGIPLPVAWAPFGTCYEHAKDGRFEFFVEIGHPLTGPIVHYRGWLVPEPARSDMSRQSAANPALVRLAVES